MNSKVKLIKPPTTHYWGVSYRPFKESVRPKFKNLDDPKVSAAYEKAQNIRAEKLSWGDPDPVFTTTAACYVSMIRIGDKPRYLGQFASEEEAAKHYDSALYHLWGYIKRPRGNFNFYKEGGPAPEFFPRIRKLLCVLRREHNKKFAETQNANDSVAAHDFNFLEEYHAD